LFLSFYSNLGTLEGVAAPAGRSIGTPMSRSPAGGSQAPSHFQQQLGGRWPKRRQFSSTRRSLGAGISFDRGVSSGHPTKKASRLARTFKHSSRKGKEGSFFSSRLSEGSTSGLRWPTLARERHRDIQEIILLERGRLLGASVCPTQQTVLRQRRRDVWTKHTLPRAPGREQGRLLAAQEEFLYSTTKKNHFRNLTCPHPGAGEPLVEG